jgi:predicted nucleic acid-binding protein
MALALLDSNVLVHAAVPSSALNIPAAKLLDRGLKSSKLYCIAPQNITEFAAVVTRVRGLSQAIPSSSVLRICELLYRSRRLTKIYPQRGTVIRAVRNGVALNITGPRWYDLFLAMTMVDAGVHTIITEDVADFGAMPFVKAVRIEDAL